MPKIASVEHSGQAHVVEVPIGNTVMEGGRNAGIEGIVVDVPEEQV